MQHALTCAIVILATIGYASGSSVHLHLKAHPGADPWEFLSRPQTRARALEQLRRRLPPSAHGLSPLPSSLPFTHRRLSDPSHLLSHAADGNKSNRADGPKRSAQQQSNVLTLPSARDQQRTARQAQIFIGVFTAASPAGALPYSKRDYAARRAVLRRTWMASAARYDHVEVRFVVGRSGGGGGGGAGAMTREAALLAAEAEQHRDFLWLDLEESYAGLAHKTFTFFATVLRLFPAVEFVIKADDDVFLLPHRLLMAADQWTAARADLVSCMTHGPVRHSRRHRWFDPAAVLVGARYPLRPQGTLYALSARAARMLAARNGTWRTAPSPEDVTLGRLLLGTNAVFWEDARLCRRGCDDAAVVALFDPLATGLSLEALVAAHMEPACQAPAVWPLPYASSLHVGLEPWLEERREAAMGALRP